MIVYELVKGLHHQFIKDGKDLRNLQQQGYEIVREGEDINKVTSVCKSLYKRIVR